LGGAEWEGEQLKANATRLGFATCHAFIGADATEAQLRRIEAPQVMHFATHGFVLSDLPASKRGTACLDQSLSRVPAQLFSNPMLRSGLALAGAQSTLEAWKRGEFVPHENDGIVTAEEISTLDLRNTQLVSLSACDTGAGQALASEGVLGLRRGFVRAGAENLLFALWSVDDTITGRFMFEFYEKLSAGLWPGRALAETQGRWLSELRREKGIAAACRTAGPFVLNFRGRTPEAE
jgi:CHAT domain-containing protein